MAADGCGSEMSWLSFTGRQGQADLRIRKYSRMTDCGDSVSDKE